MQRNKVARAENKLLIYTRKLEKHMQNLEDYSRKTKNVSLKESIDVVLKAAEMTLLRFKDEVNKPTNNGVW